MDYSNANSTASVPTIAEMVEIYRKHRAAPPVVFRTKDQEDERRLADFLRLRVEIVPLNPFPVGRIERLDALPKGVAQCVAGDRSWVIDLERGTCAEIHPLAFDMDYTQPAEFKTLCCTAVRFADRVWSAICTS